MPLPPRDPSNDTLDFCCGGRKCPKIKHENGRFLVSDDAAGSTPVALTDEQMIETVRFAAARLGLRIQE